MTFDEISFDLSDVGQEITYTITEENGGQTIDGIAYDDMEVEITVTVTDNGNGTLSVEPTYPADKEFNNTYAATGEFKPEVTKELIGRAWKEGESFTFRLIGPDGEVIEEVPVFENVPAAFNPITYSLSDAGKKYEYTISEKDLDPETQGGITNSGSIKVTVEITDLGNGRLETKATYNPTSAKIINTYTAKPVTAQINVLKSITGYIAGQDPEGNVVDRTFNITMTGPKIDGALTTSITTSGGTGTASFDEIEYTYDDMVDASGNHVTEKVFTYEVQETAGSEAGWTYDTNTYEVEVTVEDDQNGQLKVTDITKVDETSNVKIVNTFKEEEYDVTVNLTKVIDDQSDSARDAKFTFELRDADGELVDSKTVETQNLTGSIDFDTLTFKTAGTYYYTLKEIIGEESPTTGWTYDENEYEIEIAVTDNFVTAELEATVKINGKDPTVDTDSGKILLSITNVYRANPTFAKINVKKSVEDLSGSADKDTVFVFTLSADDETAPMPDSGETTVSIKDGEIASFEIPYTKVGSYTYTIQETAGDGAGWIYDTAEYSFEVVVTDVSGNLVAAINEEGNETTLTVVNKYDPEDAEAKVKARKKVTDLSKSAPENAVFTFQLYDVDNKKEVETITNGTGEMEFSAMPFAKVGDYHFTVTETGEAPNGWTYDTEPHNVLIKVKDTYEGRLQATIEYEDGEEVVITNVYQAAPAVVDPPVQKIFTGKDADKFYNKGDFTFKIEAVTEGAPMPKKEGTVVTEITNSPEYELDSKKGYYEFGEIEFTEAGTYVYKVTESGSVPNVTNDPDALTGKTLTFEVTDEDGELVVDPPTDKAQFSFTNKYDAPQTGDHNNIALLLVIMGLALAAGATSLILLKKGRKEN